MAQNSAIVWTNHSWNPWYGCHKVSQGCKHCYMFRDMKKYGKNPDVVVRSKTTFNDPYKWAKKGPAKVFTCSWSDFFIEEADEWRDEAWQVIKDTPVLTYQILTKRPERIAEHLPADWNTGYSNVWLGVSVENQEAANKRIPKLLLNKAHIHFISAEPLLDFVNLKQIVIRHSPEKKAILDALIGFGIRIPSAVDDTGFLSEHIDWVIVGGESGPDYREMKAEWARGIRDQCVASGVPLLFKQWGGLRPGGNRELDGVVWDEYPE